MRKLNLIIVSIVVVGTLTSCTLIRDDFDKCVYANECREYPIVYKNEDKVDLIDSIVKEIDSLPDNLELKYISEDFGNSHNFQFEIHLNRNFQQDDFTSYELIHKRIFTFVGEYYSNLYPENALMPELTVVFDNVTLHYDWIMYVTTITMEIDGEIKESHKDILKSITDIRDSVDIKYIELKLDFYNNHENLGTMKYTLEEHYKENGFTIEKAGFGNVAESTVDENLHSIMNLYENISINVVEDE